MQHWLSICGLLLGYRLGGPLGALLGLLIGYRLAPVREQPSNFLEATFATLGHLSKAKGQVIQHDIQFANSLMDRLQLNRAARIAAQQAFRYGKQADFHLRALLQEFRVAQAKRADLIRLFVEIQLQAAFAAGTPHPGEQAVITVIIDELAISPQQLRQLFSLLAATDAFGSINFSHYHFRDARAQHYQHAEYARQHRYRQSEQPQPTAAQQLTLTSACQVLGVNSSDETATIKRAYRKLMIQYHPDKLVAKGLSPARLEQAKQQTQKIQAAYDFIKQARNFK